MGVKQSAFRGSAIRKYAGFTLIEIMVALVLGLLILNAVIQVFLSTRQSARIQSAASQMQEDGRMAMEILNRYIRLAGYTTLPWNKGLFPANGFFGLGQVVTGGDNNINSRDSIRIRYQGAADGSITDCLGALINLGQTADITLSLSDVENGERSLRCTNNTTGNTQPLVGGLQDMQIWYGLSQGNNTIDTAGRLTGGATAYVPASQVPATQWDRVIAVRVSLLLRSVEDNLVLNPQTILFNGVNTTYTDRRMRYVMDTTINVRNQAP